MERAKIEDFKFHDLRHTFATRLAQAGVDIFKIAKLLGHKDIKITQRYSHHYSESLRDGVEVLDKVTTFYSSPMIKGLCLTRNPLCFLVEQRGICNSFATVESLKGCGDER